MDYVLAITFAFFIWWFSTGAVLYLLKMPKHTFGISMLAVTASAGMGLFGIWITAPETTAASAFCGFTCAIVIWAWHEMSFLTGYVTGSRTTSCPDDCSGTKRFLFATQTLLYHELAILGTAAFVVALTWGAPNQIGTWTFIVLWLARLSAKLNVYLGVPNLTEEFLPSHLGYLKTYFRNRPMNLLFPLSVTVSTILTTLCVDYAIAPAATPFEVAVWTLLATLIALAVVEHWFLVLPLQVAALWLWKPTSHASDTRSTSRTAPKFATAADEPPFEESIRPLVRSA